MTSKNRSARLRSTVENPTSAYVHHCVLLSGWFVFIQFHCITRLKMTEIFPAHILQVVFRNLSVHEIRRILLVCKAWHNEADIFLKDKIWFCAHRVRHIKDLWKSQRRFKNLKVISKIKTAAIEKFHSHYREVTYDSSFITDVLLALKNRKTRHKVKISRVRTSFNLTKVFNVIGSKIESLYLKDLTLDDDISKFPTETIKELELHYIEESSTRKLLGFQNLKVLKISRCDFSRDLLKSFIHGNLSLEQLHIDIYGNYSDLLSFEQLKQLKILHCFGTYISKSISLKHQLSLKCLHLEYSELIDLDMFDIASSFLELEALRVECFRSEVTDKGFREIMKLPKIKHLTTSCVGSKPFLDGVKNYNLKELHLTAIIDADFLITCSEATPNLEVIRVECLSCKDLTFLMTISKNWKNLKHMALYFEQGGMEDMLEEFQSIRFENLQALEIETDSQVLYCAEAPILKHLVVCEPRKKLVLEISQNFIDDRISLLPPNFPNLESIQFEENVDFRILSIFLKVFRKLKSITLKNIEDLSFVDILNVVCGYQGSLKLIVISGTKVSVAASKEALEKRGLSYFLECDDYLGTLKRVLLSGLDILFVE